jgi:hypothetical protein
MTKIASTEIILDLRRDLAKSFFAQSDVLLNLLDALMVGPRIGTPFELVFSPIWGYEWSSIYAALRRAAEENDVETLRRARLGWLAQPAELSEPNPRVGEWHLRVLDATNYDRPKTETVRHGFVHGVDGMRPGHALSVLTQRVASGSWHLPLEVQLIPVERHPAEFGAAQVVTFTERHGWEDKDLLVVDAGYTNQPTLAPLVKADVNVFGRVSSKRTFYLPPPVVVGQRPRGRPKVRGKKIKLNDARTVPVPDSETIVRYEDGRYFAVARWNDVRMRKWPAQPVVLYRVIEYRADGTRRYARPLWLIYVGPSPAPTLAEAQAIYPERFGVEHGLRFKKGELGLVAGQFNGPGAEPRIQWWVELVATVMWLLWAARPLARAPEVHWPTWLRTDQLTPGTMRKLAGGILCKLGIGAPQPQRRGKSPGRPRGRRFEPRPRYRLYRKRARRANLK